MNRISPKTHALNYRISKGKPTVMQTPENHRMKHGCIIMASGMGARFAGNKLMAKLNGVPLIQYVLQATEGLFAKRVVVTRHLEVAELCKSWDMETVVHNEPNRNDTVRLGMEALGACDTATFVQADQPLIGARSIERLLQRAEANPSSIWRTSFKDQPGAPVLFPAWAFDELRTLPPRKGGGFVAKAYPERVRTIKVANEWELFDVDTVEDLQTLENHLLKPDE